MAKERAQPVVEECSPESAPVINTEKVTVDAAELAMLRAIAKETLDEKGRIEAEKRNRAEFLKWVNLSTEEKTQLAADKKFAGLEGELWQVELPEHPKVRLPAHSEYEAVGRYQELCGILSTDKTFSAVRV